MVVFCALVSGKIEGDWYDAHGSPSMRYTGTEYPGTYRRKVQFKLATTPPPHALEAYVELTPESQTLNRRGVQLNVAAPPPRALEAYVEMTPGSQIDA